MGTAGCRDYHKHHTRHGSSKLAAKLQPDQKLKKKIKPNIKIKLLVLCPKEIFH
jgi:hypothetical protein